MNVIYEVNLKIAQSILPEYLAWLPAHITQMCQQQGFLSATCFEDISAWGEMNADTSQYIVQYLVAHFSDLQHYFENHASSMRQEAISRFGDKFTVTRRILKPKVL